MNIKHAQLLMSIIAGFFIAIILYCVQSCMEITPLELPAHTKPFVAPTTKPEPQIHDDTTKVTYPVKEPTKEG